MADEQPAPAAAPATQTRHERLAARRAGRTPAERRAHAGDVVGHVSNGLKLLTLGRSNPVSGIVGRVADGLKEGAGEAPNRKQLASNTTRGSKS